MIKVLTAEQMREVDRLTTDRYGIPSILLMENAAHAVARVITEKLGGSVKGKSILILCGKGNNGGDGAALARILSLAGAYIDVVLFGRVKDTKGDARTNFGVLCAEDFEYDDVLSSFFCEMHEIESKDAWNTFQLHHWQDADIVVDAIFGTGLTRSLEIWLYNVIHELNFLGEDTERKPRLRVAIDIPSGLNADTGEQLDIAFQSDVTVTFTAPKAGNVLPGAARFNGELIVAEIGSEPDLIDEQPSQLYLAERDDASSWLEETAFSSNDYKNKRGHALIVAGFQDYSGAAVMCGNSAMRSGVGLTTLLVPASCKVEVASRVIPEVIVGTLSEMDGEVSSDALATNEDAIRQADSILIGPGLKATDKGVEKLVRKIVETRTVPVVVDAGALWFFSLPKGLGDGVVLSSRSEQTYAEPRVENHPVGSKQPTPLLRKEGSRVPLILTPHEGEFLRLLGTDDKEAIRDRVAAVREYAVANNVILVLKGERVLIGSPDGRVVVNPTGNSGLGKAGNGDTLAGILAGFVAQAVKFEIDIFETVVAAVYVAGLAGDVAERRYGKRVMTASDVRECLVDVFAEFE
ncbi:MAG: NAD(P)H-hydrate dehydratase [Pyrinomonadaceae bacterium]